MYDDLKRLRERFEDPLTEERVWLSDYGRYDQNMDPDRVESVVSDYADRIEQSLTAVASTERYEPPTFGGVETESTVLVVVMGRGADRTVIEGALERIDHEIRDEIHHGGDA